VIAATAESPVAAKSAMAMRRWAWVVLAALAMLATMPGRTQGLGLITEPLMADLKVGRVDFAAINLWATLLGGLFCLPCGWLADHFGIRSTLVGVVLLLAATVLLMSHLPAGYAIIPLAGAELFVLVLLTRGFGQSALSVVSLALIGRVAGRRGSIAMAVYSALVTLFFMAAFGLAKLAVEQWHANWRELWGGIGWVLLVGVVPVAWIVAPGSNRSNGENALAEKAEGSTLGEALCTPSFWVFALATSLYGLIAAGVSLFNQSILAERGFDARIFRTITVVTPLVGLAGNLLAGWLARSYGLNRLMAVAMLLLAAALVVFPWVSTETQVYAYAVVLGFAGGMVTMIFFAVWARLFGTAHLGRIQGAAQMLTVVASAFGPLLLALSKQHAGSYIPLFQIMAAASTVLAVAAWQLKSR
jgi:MFS family permease